MVSQRDGEERHELLPPGHICVTGRAAREQARDAHLDGQRGAEVEDAHVLGGDAVEGADVLLCQHLALGDVVERLLVGEEQVERERVRAGVLAAHRHDGIHEGAGLLLATCRAHPTSSSSRRNVSMGCSTSMAWCTLKRNASPRSMTERGKGHATVVPPRQPGLLACMKAYQMMLVMVAPISGSGASTSAMITAS